MIKILNSACNQLFNALYLFSMAYSSLLGFEFSFFALKIVLKAVSAIKNTASQYLFNL
ncbi:hypothetical protein [Helicobacter pylori]